MRILDFFRDDADVYAKLRRSVLPLAFQQFMSAAVSASDGAHARCFVAGFSFCSVTGRADYVYLQFIYGWLYDRDEHPGCSVLWKWEEITLPKIFAYVLRISALVSAGLLSPCLLP